MESSRVRKNIPAVIVSAESSTWQSCRIITPNLEKAYREIFPSGFNTFSFTHRMDVDLSDFRNHALLDLARRIYESRPSKLIFIDHSPHPLFLIQTLSALYGSSPLPELCFHIYGDFTLYAKRWYEMEPLLRKTRVRFVCASHRQQALVQRFLMAPTAHARRTDSVVRCPFPVDPETYSFDPAVRKEWRKRIGLGPHEMAILYTGRMSLQKNIVRMTREALAFSRRTGVPIRFFFAGVFDDLAAPFFSVKVQAGFYYQYWRRLLEHLDPSERGRFEYLGQFGAADLRGLYHAADTYFSLSLHHDEDFGMSPAESLLCGTPVILTDWGGYTSFRLEGRPEVDCQIVPVTIGRQGLLISRRAVHVAFERVAGTLAAHPPGSKAESKIRRERGRAFHAAFSVEEAARLIGEIHRSPAPVFPGFNWRMQKFVESWIQGSPFRVGPTKGTFYEEIYGTYATDVEQ